MIRIYCHASARLPPSPSTLVPANAQDGDILAGEPGASGTAYTGDVIEGKKVVSALDVNDLEPGQKAPSVFPGRADAHRTALVCVCDGRQGRKAGQARRPGQWCAWRRDEFHAYGPDRDEPARSGGDVGHGDGGHGRFPPGPGKHAAQMAQFGQRHRSDRYESGMAGNENGVTAPSRHAGLLFNRLLRPNADFAIDFHTGTTGFDVTAFNIAGMDVPEVKAMVELYPVGQIFDNHVYPGVLHNAFMDVGIPSFTPEIGAARVLDLEMISLFVEGTMNVLKHHGIVAGPMGRTGKDVSVFVGNSAFPILATAGGLVEHLVKLNDKVEAGQKVAIQRNSFGEVVAEYTSGVAGEITGQRSDAMSEPGNPLVFILFNKASPEDVEAYPE